MEIDDGREHAFTAFDEKVSVSSTPPPRSAERKSVTWTPTAEEPEKRQSFVRGRKKSMATEAFEQAVLNQNYIMKNQREMDLLSEDNSELHNFLQRKQSWKDGCGHNIATFASRMREAMAAKKAANKFLLTALGRRLKQSPGQASSSSTSRPPALPGLGPSAILDYANKKREQASAPSGPPETSTEYYKTFTCTRAVLPTSSRRRINLLPPALSQMAVAAPKKPPATLSPLRERPVAKVGAGSKLPPDRAVAMLPREHDRVTVVAGTVDYAGLLEDQADTFATLARKDKEYVELIETYDKIQYNIQRKFSMLLKVENSAFLNLGGLRSMPGEEEEEEEPEEGESGGG